MKISTQLKLAALVPVLMALIIGLALLFSYTEMEKARERGKTAQRIMNSVNELNSLAHSYMLYHEERPKQQFLLEYDATIKLLSTVRFKDREKELLDNIREDSEPMKSSFLKLVSTYERHGSGIDALLLREAEERLAGRLLSGSRDVLSEAVRLNNLIDEEITKTQKRISMLILFLIAATTVPPTIALTRMMTGISASLAALRKGTLAIGAGNLDHRIGMTSPDEIGELSGSFDQMAEQLKETTVSRDALSKEVEERKRAEEALGLAFGRLQTFFDHRIGGIGIVIANAKGNILQANDYYLNILAVTREELLSGQVDWRRMTPPEWLPADERALEQLRERGACDTYEKEYMRCDGARVPVLLTDVMMPGDSGDILAFVLDITERKRAEEELRKAHDELELRVRKRTEELAATVDTLREETLERLQAMEALREKEQLLLQQSRLAAMGEMINNIAHQWRQPLNVLGLLVQQVRLFYEMGSFSKEYLNESVNKSMGLINHMSQTIDDFRNFFKPQKEKVQFTIHEVVARTVSLVEDSFRNQQISIHTHASANPTIIGFPNEYSQVLLNILMNARDALLERQIIDAEVRITISKEGEKAVVTIADNAGGITEEIMSKIFEPYFTTKGPDKGTGVGLFMSKTIIEKNMNGRLTVRNTTEGAEFRIEV